jgi:hypothetical protein
VNLLRQYSLFIQLHAASSVNVAIFDTETNTCLLFESYTFHQSTNVNIGKYINQLRELWNNHHCLKAGFWQNVNIVIADSMATVIPIHFYDNQTVNELLAFNVRFDKEKHTLSEQKNISLNTKCVFCVENVLIDWFKDTYPNLSVNFLHSTAVFLEQLVKSAFVSSANTVFVSVHDSSFTMVVFQDEALRFVNTFKFDDSNSFIYFLIFAIDEIGLSTRYCKLVLWGDIDENSHIYKKVKAYFKNIEWGKRPAGFIGSYQFDELPENIGFDFIGAYYA